MKKNRHPSRKMRGGTTTDLTEYSGSIPLSIECNYNGVNQSFNYDHQNKTLKYTNCTKYSDVKTPTYTALNIPDIYKVIYDNGTNIIKFSYNSSAGGGYRSIDFTLPKKLHYPNNETFRLQPEQ